jgi:hypothetical protein
MKEKSSLKEDLKWLNSDPPLHELMGRYPDQWKEVGQELISVLEDGRAERLNECAAKAKAMALRGNEQILKSRNNPSALQTALPFLIKSRMWLLALEKCFLAAATGKTEGKIRFNLFNGFLIQKLLFSEHLTRKPASLFWFNLFWPLITQKRILMPLVQPRGIYCFYSGRLIKELTTMIGRRPCLEIGAGDGTLSRFLAESGVRITATDDHSWSHIVSYPASVERIGAKEALEKHLPKVVICSWPPPGNPFERYVFSTRSVELYIVIGSRYPFASGNWGAYAGQSEFSWEMDPRLSRYLIPPELDSAVLLFSRKAS